jgi:hypothetical protein
MPYYIFDTDDSNFTREYTEWRYGAPRFNSLRFRLTHTPKLHSRLFLNLYFDRLKKWMCSRCEMFGLWSLICVVRRSSVAFDSL